jgi:outer membrane protein OmpA-like peptidoglycan-associated protein
MIDLSKQASLGEFARKRAAGLLCIGTALLLLFFAGCAKLNPESVERARAAVESARQDPNIDQGRSTHFQEAERHLAVAESEFEKNNFQAGLDHEAYLAETHAKVAIVEAAARRDSEEASSLLEQARADTAGTGRVVEAAIRRAEALEARQTERGLVLTLGGVLFEFDSAELKPEAQVSVARVAGFLIALDDRHVLVEGHTDNVGKADYNLELSDRRAGAVRQVLVENRVSAWRIEAEGFGDQFPMASNESDEGQQANRRVELIILDPGKSTAEARRKR